MTRKMSSQPQAPDRAQDTDAPAGLMMRAAFKPGTLDAENRTIEVVFGSDAPVRMYTWDYGPIEEELSFDPTHVRMDRLNSGAPVLDNHDMYGSVLDTVLGVVERAWSDGKKGYAKLRFARTEKADKVLEMTRDGILQNISVGYQVHKYMRSKATEEGKLDKYRAVDWEPHEISMVAVPADYGAKVRSVKLDAGSLAVEDDATTPTPTAQVREMEEMATPAEVKTGAIEYAAKAIEDLNEAIACCNSFAENAASYAATDPANTELYNRAAEVAMTAAAANRAAIATMTEIIAALNGERNVNDDTINQRSRELALLKARF